MFKNTEQRSRSIVSIDHRSLNALQLQGIELSDRVVARISAKSDLETRPWTISVPANEKQGAQAT